MTATQDKIDLARYVYIPGVSEVDDVDLDIEPHYNAATGLRVTEADVAAEADAVEARYRGLVPGGKSLSGGGSHSPVLRFVASVDTCDEVARRAKSEKMSVSRWLRRTVEEKLAA